MFTGIVREVGRIISVSEPGDRRLRIACGRAPESIDIGASVACNGVCLTVVAKGGEADAAWFDVDASAETCAKTTAGSWTDGTAINLEPALRLGDELGGHIVSGHVDATGEVTAIRPEGASLRVTISVPEDLARYIAPKGSVTVDGISLTVNEVSADSFGVNIIPHTLSATNLSDVAPGRRVNLEIDILARYVARLRESES